MKSILAAIILIFTCLSSARGEETCPITTPTKLTRLSFSAAGLLAASDLARNIQVQVGKECTCTDIEKAKEQLFARGVFSRVDSEVKIEDIGVAVHFELVPRRIIYGVSISGVRIFSLVKAQQILSLRIGSTADSDRIRDAAARLQKRYAAQGYNQATVNWTVEEGGAAEAHVVFTVEEGDPLRIRAFAFSEPVPASLENQFRDVEESWRGKPASSDNMKQATKELLRSARRSGYLQSSLRLTGSEKEEGSSDVTLSFQTKFRERLSIDFSGNSVFDDKELREPLGLETRTVPILAGALPSLVRSVESLYEEKGFCDANATLERVEPTANEEGPEMRAEIRVEEGKRCRVQRILIEGNESIGANQLRPLIATETTDFLHWTKGFLIRAQLKDDEKRIEDFYVRRGFDDVDVTTEVLRDTEEPEKVSIVFKVSEGKRTNIESVQIRWKGVETPLPPGLEELLGEISRVEPGEPRQPINLIRERNRIIRLLHQFGYPRAAVTLNQEVERGQVEYVIDPGPRIAVGKIVTQGNLFIHDTVLLRDLRVAPGMPWDETLIKSSEAAVSQLGLFQSVRIEPLDGTLDSPVEDMSVKVSERPGGKLDIGSTFNTEDGLRIFGEAGQRNLSGHGDGLSGVIDTYFKTGGSVFDAGRGSVRYRILHPFGLEGELATEGFFQTSIETYRQFSFDRVGLSSTYRTPLGEQTKLNFGILTYRERLFDVDSDVVIGPDDEGQSLFSFLFSEIRYDRRDNQYNPREGSLSTLQLRYAGQATGSEVNLFGITGQQSFFTPVSEKLVWANNFRGSIMYALGDTDTVPISQRFFLGGQTSLRGFSRNVIGPRGELLHIVGGDRAIQYNTELRYSLTESLLGLVFFDAGQAFLRQEGTFEGDPLDFDDLRFSPGIGVGYMTPVGPLVAQYGVALDREFGERLGRLYFGFGGSF